MELTQEAKATIEEAKKKEPTDWLHDEEAQAANQRYLKNAELIKKVEQLKYRYDVLDGEIKGIQFSKSRFKSKLIAHIMLCIAFILFYVLVLANNFLGIFVLPFYIAAFIAEIVKVYKDMKPYVINLPMFEDYCKAHGIKTMDISLEEKTIEQRAVKGEIAELDSKIEKRSQRGEDMIS